MAVPGINTSAKESEPAVTLDELNSAQDEYPDWVSADGCHILISSQRSGGKGPSDIYFAAKP